MAILRALLLRLLLQTGAHLVQAQSSSPASSTSEPSPSTITTITTSISISTSTATSTATTTTTDATRVVPIFYLDERAFEGLPYTLLHRVCGSVLSADETATTFVITTTRVDLRGTTSPTRTNTGNITTAIPTLKSRPPSFSYNATGQPSTITQGPQTFAFTGTRWGDPSRTIVNQCRLNGTANARCNLTHVGEVWYTHDQAWNGTFSTYSYNWTSGDRYGFAPVTVTSGVEMMGPPTLTATTSSNGAGGVGGGRGRGEEVRGLAGAALVIGAFVFGLFLVV